MLVQGSSEKENAPKSGNVPVRALPMKPVSSNVFGSIFSNDVPSPFLHRTFPLMFVINKYDGLLRGIDLETFPS